MDDFTDDHTKDNTQYQGDQIGPDVPEQPLPQDGDTPAAPPSDVQIDPNVPTDHPQTDTGVDQHEAYDAGVATASGANAQDDEEHEDETRVA